MKTKTQGCSQESLSHQNMFEAARDFFMFQNRGYPRKAALEWVGNRYQLEKMQRQLLHRGVFGQSAALRRLARQARGLVWEKERLIVDGHNVQITLESAVLGRTLIKANDGVLRDVAGQSAKFKLSEASEVAMDMLFAFLRHYRPEEVLFYFDAPISGSGLLAQKYRGRLHSAGLRGKAMAVPVPEREFPYYDSIIASSDHAIMDRALRWLDLAQIALRFSQVLNLNIDFSLITSATIKNHHPSMLPFW